MIVLNLVQGTPEWAAHRAKTFNASDAAAMMGASKYTTRSMLLHRMATGIVEEISPELQARFDRGHETEARARPLVEDMIGEELFPIVGISEEHRPLGASFDGVTADGTTGFEHKLWNQSVAESVRNGSIVDDPAYYWQMEQQILVAGLEKVIFVCSDGTPDNFEWITYTAKPGRREQLLAGWVQFQDDLGTYVPKVAKAEVVAAPVGSLPTIVYKLNGLALTSNLDEYRKAADVLVERSRAPLVTDQDFADRDALCKAFGEAEKRIDVMIEQVVGEIHDVAEFQRGLGDIREMFRSARLASEKLVKAEKDNRKLAIQQAGAKALTAHVAALQERIIGAGLTMPAIAADFAVATKGLRTLDSMQNAVDSLLAQKKIEANAVADGIEANLRTLDADAPDHLFLFRDLQSLVTMPAEAFRATVTGRVAEHKAKEEARLAAERERIATEEREKIESEQASKLAGQAAATPDVAPAPQVTTPAPAHAPSMAFQKPHRPTDQQIIAALAKEFGASPKVVISWLREMNFEGATA